MAFTYFVTKKSGLPGQILATILSRTLPIGACTIVKKWESAFVRTTIELPDPLFREVKATAARQGKRLKDYISEALQDKLAKLPVSAEKPWMKFAGIAAHDPEMVAELKRIEQIVEENFEQIEEEEWK